MMVIPVLVYMALFKYLPMYYLRAAFYDFKLLKGFEGSKYVGTKWFERLLSSPELWQYIRNTLSLNLLSLAICFPAPLIFALLLNEVRNVPYKKVVQTISYMPHFISVVVLVGMMNVFLSPSNGLVNVIIKMMGGQAVYFMGEASLARMRFWEPSAEDRQAPDWRRFRRELPDEWEGCDMPAAGQTGRPDAGTAR